MRHDQKGMTLLEVLIAMAILSVALAALYLMLTNSASTYTNQTRVGAIQDDARRVMDIMANEIRLADQNPKTFQITGPSGGPNGITFVVPAQFLNGSVVWSTPINYQLQASVFDPTQDSVVRTQNGVSSRLCNYTAPTGLTIIRTGNNVVLTLNLTILDDSNKATLKATVQTSITLRNSS